MAIYTNTYKRDIYDCSSSVKQGQLAMNPPLLQLSSESTAHGQV